MSKHEQAIAIRELTGDELSAVAGGDLIGALTGGHYGNIGEAIRKGLDEAMLSQQH